MSLLSFISACPRAFLPAREKSRSRRLKLESLSRLEGDVGCDAGDLVKNPRVIIVIRLLLSFLGSAILRGTERGRCWRCKFLNNHFAPFASLTNTHRPRYKSVFIDAAGIAWSNDLKTANHLLPRMRAESGNSTCIKYTREFTANVQK